MALIAQTEEGLRWLRVKRRNPRDWIENFNRSIKMRGKKSRPNPQNLWIYPWLDRQVLDLNRQTILLLLDNRQICCLVLRPLSPTFSIGQFSRFGTIVNQHNPINEDPLTTTMKSLACTIVLLATAIALHFENGQAVHLRKEEELVVRAVTANDLRHRQLSKNKSTSKTSKAKTKSSSKKSSKSKSGTKESVPKMSPPPVVTSAPVAVPTSPPTSAPVPAPIVETLEPDTALTRSLPLRQALTEEGMVAHLQALQDIANANNNNRATGTPGYAMSVNYVVSELKAAGYNVVTQNFTTDVYWDLDASLTSISTADGSVVKNYTNKVDFDVMTFSFPGEASGLAQKVDNVGCNASDFAFFQAGNIAIIERGHCNFVDKALLAQLAGAPAVIVYNNIPDELNLGLLVGGIGAVTVPVITATQAVGLELIGQTLSLVSDVILIQDVVTQNIIADTEFGNASQTVVIGGHLDSVIEGPGINDNGSAVTVALELALQIAKNGFQSKNRIRFAFWGAEELGLIGSEYYLRNLFFTEGPGAVQDMKLYLNLEMLASANFVRAIYPPMSTSLDSINVEEQVVQIFEEYFASEGILAIVLPEPFVPELRSRSDHYNFQSELVNIPAGGVITGANIPKTPELAGTFLAVNIFFIDNPFSHRYVILLLQPCLVERSVSGQHPATTCCAMI